MVSHRSSRSQVVFIISVLKKIANFTENICARVSLYQSCILDEAYFCIKFRQAWSFIKKSPAQVFSCEFCKMFKNNFTQNTFGDWFCSYIREPVNLWHHPVSIEITTFLKCSLTRKGLLTKTKNFAIFLLLEKQNDLFA